VLFFYLTTRMQAVLRARVLHSYRRLLQAQAELFGDDIANSLKAVQRVREEYRKNLSVTEPKKIEELAKFAEDCLDVIEKSAVQIERKQDNSDTWRLVLRNTTRYLKETPRKREQ